MTTKNLDQENDLSHSAATDLWVGIKSWQIWFTLGQHDIKQRYRRSVIGPFWFTLSTAIMVGVLGVLYSTLLKQKIDDYLPYLGVGLVVWQYFATTVLESCIGLISMSYLIKQIRIPLTIHVCRVIWRNFVILMHSLPVAILTLFIFGHKIGVEILLLPLGLIIILLHGVWIGTVLAILCARFRDIPPIIGNVVQIAFFFTPVMWSPEALKDRAWVAQFNPIYHLLEIVRAPIVGRPILLESWVWSIAFLVVGFTFAQWLLTKCRERIPYWL